VYLAVDLSVVPPVTTLHEADDFTAFKVIVRGGEEAHVPVASLRQLAGDRATDPEWQGSLEKMLEFADGRGWLDERGIQAHVERET
jgi:hypothetical protein